MQAVSRQSELERRLDPWPEDLDVEIGGGGSDPINPKS